MTFYLALQKNYWKFAACKKSFIPEEKSKELSLGENKFKHSETFGAVTVPYLESLLLLSI